MTTPAVQKARAARGLCPDCATPHNAKEQKRRLCTNCAERKNARTRKWRNAQKIAGLCSCNKPVHKAGARWCRACIQNMQSKNRALYGNRRVRGKCRGCGGPPVEGGGTRNCRPCWFKEMAGKFLGSVHLAQLLQLLFEQQNGRCFYSKEKLIEGRNTSIDHQVPLSRGGTNDMGNLRWVTPTVNQAKGQMTHGEFVRFCATVAATLSNQGRRR